MLIGSTETAGNNQIFVPALSNSKKTELIFISIGQLLSSLLADKRTRK